MADAKITGLAALAANPADNDMFVIVDVSDTSMASTGTDKKLAASYVSFRTNTETLTNKTLTSPIFNTGATFNNLQPVLIGSGAAYGYHTYSYMAGASGGGQDIFLRAGGTSASPTATLNNMGLGSFSFRGYSGSFTGSKALIGAYAAEDWTVSANGTYFQFQTTTNGSTTLTTRMTISNNGNVGVGQSAPTGTATALMHLGASSASRASLRIESGTVPTSPNDGDIARGTTGFTLYNIDSGTNAIINHVIVNRMSTGTPAAGFGVGFAALLESSTTVDQNAGRLTFAWSTATHASRAAVGKLTAYYTSTEREAITWTADSASVTVSIAGNTRATGSVQVTGSAFASHTGGKSFNAQGAGYDGTRYWAGYVGLGAYWDATNWKTGTDGGSNGASLIISQGLGDDLSFYTMTSTGTSQQTIAHGSLASSLRLTLNASYAAFTGAVRSGYDTNLTSYFGRAAIGYNGSTSDVASFGHIDMNSAANIALFQTAAGESWFNCASGQNLIFARGGFSLGQWDTSGNLHPAVDNTVDCGKSGSRWNDIWASNATIQTSDQRDKKAIKPSALGLDFVKALQPMSWAWKDGKRPHYGFIAQQVKQAMDAVGVDDFAGYIYDEATDSYSLRYSEFLSPIVKALQELLQRVERLEKAN